MKKNRLLILLFILIILIGMFSITFFHVDPDFLWHLKAGEYMFKHGIITHDVFSWITSGKYWMSHEWLFEMIIYLFKHIFGDFYIFIYLSLFITLLILILFIPNKNNITKNIPFTLFWILQFLIIIPFIQVRPHIISFSLLGLTIYFLYDLYKNEESKKIYFLPIISIFWANVHGGSSNLPYLLCLLFIITGLFQFKFSKIEANRLCKVKIKKYFIIMILCMISVCINIHGVKMFIYPYTNMLDTTMINNISEWQSTSLNNFTSYMYFFLLLFIIVTMLLSKKKIEFMDFILLGFFTFLGLKIIRFWFYSYICMSFIIFNYVPKIKKDNGTEICICIFSLFLLIGFIKNINNLFNIKYYCYLNQKTIEFIKNEKPKRLFNMYDYGGELVYNDQSVFIDGRADLYGKYNYKDYLKIVYLNKNIDNLLDKYNFDYLLVSTHYPVYTYMNKNTNYSSVFTNKKYVIYKKN